MVKRVYIVHGSNFKDKERMKRKDFISQNKKHWIPWIRRELEKKGIKTYAPLMPENWDPKYGKWRKEFEKFDIYENSILIGASAGGAFLVRWLGNTGRKIKKLILIAPGKVVTKYNKYLKEFYDFNINGNIKNNAKWIIIFVSDNEENEIKDSVKIYEKELKAKVIELKGKGHFLIHQMGTEEFPELLKEIIK